MESRVMETQMLYIKDRLTGEFENIKEYMEHDISTERNQWSRTTKKYRKELDLTWEEIMDMDKKRLKSLIKEWYTNQWKKEIETKKSLNWYKEGKHHNKYEECYRNYKIRNTWHEPEATLCN